jgi:hypothetical protein
MALPTEELTAAVAPDSGNYGALGQARFINTKQGSPLITLSELSAEESKTLVNRCKSALDGNWAA